MPVGLAPVGLSGMYARRGETQAAQSGGGERMSLSRFRRSACARSRKSRGRRTAPFWFQLYVVRDRGFMRELIARAREAQVRGVAVHRGPADAGFALSRRAVGTDRVERDCSEASADWGRCWRVRGWLWDVGLHGRPHSIGNLAKVVGTGSGLDDFGTGSRATSTRR